METRSERHGYRSANSSTHRKVSRSGTRIALVAIGTILCTFTIINICVGNRNLGTYLPLIAGLPLLLWGIFKPGMDRWVATKAGRIVRIIVIVVYVGVVCIVGAWSVAMIVAASNAPDPGADAIIVLGAAVHGDEVTDTLEKRLNKTLEYWKTSPDTLIVVSGGMGSNENISEAAAMQKYLTEAGVPESSIQMEDQSSSTRENFAFSKKILDDRFGPGTYHAVYVTSDFHVLRAGHEAERAGLTDAEGLASPTPFFTIPGAWLRECAALTFYGVRDLF